MSMRLALQVWLESILNLVFVRGTRPTRQKVLPNPTVGAPSASNSPSALSAQARAGQRLRFRLAHHRTALRYFLHWGWPQVCNQLKRHL